MSRRWPARSRPCEPGYRVNPVTPRSIAVFVLLTLVWGSTWLVIKDQIGLVPAAWSVTWRFLLAGTAMLAIASLRGDRVKLPVRTLGFAALIGMFQFTINFQLVYASELYLTSGLVAVVFALMLAPNAILARAFLGNPIGTRFIAGSLVASVGVAMLMVHEYRAAPAGIAVGTGALLALGATLSASVGNVMQASGAARRNAVMPLIGWAMLFGALGDALYAWLTLGPPMFDTSPRFMAGTAYLALVGSVLTFPLYSQLLREWGPGKAAYTNVAIPVVAMLLSTLFERFAWTGLAVGGAVLAMAGLLIALSPAKAGA